MSPAWHCERMQVQRIDPEDSASFAAWFAILRLTDEERWADVPGWDENLVKSMARQVGGGQEFHCLAAVDGSGTMLGMAGMELPMRDNTHSLGFEVRVLPEYRRQGIGTAIVEEVARRALDDGRTTLNCLFEVPTHMVGAEPSEPFLRSLGFTSTQSGNRRSLALPVDPVRLAALKDEVSKAAVGYRMLTFTAPWPEEFDDDQCELNRRMSTDAPSGDASHEEMVFDKARIVESDKLLAEQGLTKLVAVAQDIATGRLVAFSELVVSDLRPNEAWQWATLVLGEHRGHRLGLAVKMANLAYLEEVFPSARSILTGNAQENTPMIAVNEMLGFEVVGTGMFWQKTLSA